MVDHATFPCHIPMHDHGPNGPNGTWGTEFIEYTIGISLPSGKCLQFANWKITIFKFGKSTNYSWPFSSSQSVTNYSRGYPMNYHQVPHRSRFLMPKKTIGGIWPHYQLEVSKSPHGMTPQNNHENTHLKPFGCGSIPINTIFRGMNIHLPAILM